MSEIAPPSLDGQVDQQVSEDINMQIAFAAVQAARRETFLARYPRKLKLAVTFLLLALLAAPFWLGGPPHDVVREAHHEEEASPLPDETSLQEESAAQAAAPSSHGEAKPAAPPPTAAPALAAFKTEAEGQAAAINDVAVTQPASPLAAAPDPALAEEGTHGTLPRVSDDGRKPWQVYARPFDHRDPRPRVVLVVGDLGLSRVATDAALLQLPAPVTLAFDGQAPALKEWLDRARQDGHESLLSIPMEPSDYPRSDPGPDTLLTTLPTSDNVMRFLAFLREGAGYVGVTSLTGSRFMADPLKVAPIIDILRARGLLLFDTHIASHSVLETIAREMSVPVAANSRVIDAAATPAAIDEALNQLEQTARVEGVAIGMASPLPVTLERIEKWAKTLADRGLVLAPLSAAVK